MKKEKLGRHGQNADSTTQSAIASEDNEDRIMRAIIELMRNTTAIPSYEMIASYAQISPGVVEQCCVTTGKKGNWVAIEDQCLQKIMGLGPKKKWCNVAALLPGRVGKQCRERWINHLMPGIKRGAWDAEEDELLIRLQKELGNCWSKIALQIPGRSENAVKNRWNSFINKMCDSLVTKVGASLTPRSRRSTKSGNTSSITINTAVASDLKINDFERLSPLCTPPFSLETPFRFPGPPFENQLKIDVAGLDFDANKHWPTISPVGGSVTPSARPFSASPLAGKRKRDELSETKSLAPLSPMSLIFKNSDAGSGTSPLMLVNCPSAWDHVQYSACAAGGHMPESCSI